MTEYPLIKPKYYYKLLIDIIAFIKAPHIERDTIKPIKTKLYDTIALFILKMMFLIPVLLFFALVYDPDNVQSQNMADRFSPLVLLLVGGIILPLVEEIAFRLSLVFKPFYFALSSSALFYYLLTKAVFQTKISAFDDTFFLRLWGSLGFGIIIYLAVNRTAVRQLLEKFWVANFRYIYYLSCIVFAWMHLSKYELIWLNVVLLPILTLPQLMSAIIYGYTRVVFGFQYPLLIHITMNTVAIGLSVI
jgi:hypothetical protein